MARLVARTLAIGLLGLASCGRTRSQVGVMANGGAGAGAAGAVGGAASSGGDGAAAAGGGLSTQSDGNPIYTRAGRLTSSQFEHAATDILGLVEGTDLKSNLPRPALVAADFSNNERGLYVDARAFTQLEEAAEKAAELATGSAEALARVYPGTDPEGFVRSLGRRAFRRPLVEAEVARYLGVLARGQELYGAGFAAGASLVIRAMLQSPSFLYRTELGPAGEPLSSYEIASKLSFWLLDTTPSDALLDAAAKGELDSEQGLLSAARAMLEDRAAEGVMRTFHRELYRLDRFDVLTKSGAPEWSEALGLEAKEASLAFFDRIYTGGEGLRDILLSPRGFVGPRLAPLYGQTAPTMLEDRELGPERLGYFMQVPRLMLDSPGTRPDPIHRGIDMALDVLCLQLPAPPLELPAIPDFAPEQTNRERLESYIGSCGGSCHSRYLDPLGLAFEGFDGMGVARSTDGGRPVDASGTFLFAGGEDSFDDARELMQQLADDELPYACYGRKLASYGLQRDIAAGDAELVAELAEGARRASVKDLMLALVASPAFRLRHEDLP